MTHVSGTISCQIPRSWAAEFLTPFNKNCCHQDDDCASSCYTMAEYCDLFHKPRHRRHAMEDRSKRERRAVIVEDMLRGFLESGRPLDCGDTARAIIPAVRRR